MATRRRFLETVSGGLTGSWLARALPLGVGVGVLGWPRDTLALASGCVVLDTFHSEANFVKDGNQTVTPGNSLVLTDGSNADHVGFFAEDPCTATGEDVDVVATFRVVNNSTPAGVDVGARFIITDGVTSAIAASVILGGIPGIAIAIGTDFNSPGNYAAFVPVDWLAPVNLRLRRWANGDAEIVEVNGVAPSPRAIVPAGALPGAVRATPSVGFGLFSDGAVTTAEFGSFRSETPATQIMGALAFTDFRIRDDGSADRLRFRADFTLGAGSDGIDPSTELVNVRLSTPTYGQFYPPRAFTDFNPLSGFDVRGRTPRRRWSLNAAERTRTGIERLDFDENPHQTGAIVLRDLRTSLPTLDYSTVIVMVDSGFDRFTETIQLVEKRAGSGQWRLPR